MGKVGRPRKIPSVDDNHELKNAAREMILKGQTDADIADSTHLTPNIVGQIRNWLKSRNGRNWAVMTHPNLTEMSLMQVLTGQPATENLLPPPPLPASETTQPQEETPETETVTEPEGSTPPEEPQLPETSPMPSPPALAPVPRIEAVRHPQPPLQQSQSGGQQTLMMPPQTPLPSIYGQGAASVEIPSLPAAGKGRGNVNVTPWTLVWFDMANADWQKKYGEQYPFGLPGYIEDCIRDDMMLRDKGFIFHDGGYQAAMAAQKQQSLARLRRDLGEEEVEE